MCPALVQNIQNLLSGQRDYRTRTKNTDHAFIIQKLIILLGNRSANDHHNVITAKLFQLPDNLRNQRLMASRPTGDAQNVYVIFNRWTSCFFRNLKERANLYIKTEIGEAGGNYFRTAVVAVLAHLSYHNARAASFQLRKTIGHLLGFLKVLVIINF